MSVLISDIRLYGSANMPEADSATVGGAITFTKRVEWADITANGLFDIVSSSASDTATKVIYAGRDATGAIVNETKTLTGTTKVAGTLTLERLLYGLASGATSDFGLTTPGGTQAVGDVAVMARTLTITAHTMQAGSANATTTAPAIAKLQSGDGASVAVGQIIRTTGGTGPNQIRRILAINPGALGADVVAVDRNWGTVPDNTTTYEVAYGFHFELAGSNGGAALTSATQTLAITRLFATATADVSGGSSRTFYEKVFVNNNNQTTALTSAQVEVLSESPSLPGSATLDLALCTGFNDTNTSTNRQTAPASGAGTFTTQPAFISVPSTGNLAASAGSASATNALGMWLRLTLPAGTAAYKGAATLRTQGSTT